MKLLLRTLGAFVVLIAVLGILQLVASESGEVVVLTTFDEAGESHETRLWVVEHEGHTWLRAGADVQGWYQRLKGRPEIDLERDGSRTAYEAVPEPGQREPINARMREKYGWADQFIGLLFGRDDSIPVKLVPREAP